MKKIRDISNYEFLLQCIQATNMREREREHLTNNQLTHIYFICIHSNKQTNKQNIFIKWWTYIFALKTHFLIWREDFFKLYKNKTKYIWILFHTHTQIGIYTKHTHTQKPNRNVCFIVFFSRAYHKIPTTSAKIPTK